MAPAPPSWLQSLVSEGYAIIPNAVDHRCIRNLVQAIERVGDEAGVRAKKSATYAVRNLLSLVPEVRALASTSEMRAVVEPILGTRAIVVRGLLFDKSPDANWKVAWHQDLSIAVKNRIEAPGFGPWSEKAGVVHVQPPVRVLEEMLTVRLHLDDCFEDNGPLQVLPGSHRLGLIDPESIARLREEISPVSCTVGVGGVVLMRPLILHASPTASDPDHRRVVHIEYASDDALPAGIEWHESD
jgi:ectoine hydroxylase-related dioxygenase (phytanoyl-CoA dioxygenase family)